MKERFFYILKQVHVVVPVGEPKKAGRPWKGLVCTVTVTGNATSLSVTDKTVNVQTLLT